MLDYEPMPSIAPRPTMTNQEARSEIQGHIDNYLKNGGKIDQVPFGVSGRKDSPNFRDLNEQDANNQLQRNINEDIFSS